MNNPYETPVDSQTPKTSRGGVGRLNFLILMLGVVFPVFGVTVSLPFTIQGIALESLWLGMFAAIAILVGMRLLNIGVSPVLALLLFVPLLNFMLMIFCMVYPENAYVDDKLKLDPTGRRLLLVLGTFFVVAVGGMIVCTAVVLNGIGR